MICCIAGGRFPKEFVKENGPLHQLENIIKIRERERQLGYKGSSSNMQAFKEVFHLFFPYFLELIVSVDWLELSKEPWHTMIGSKKDKGFKKELLTLFDFFLGLCYIKKVFHL